MAYRKSSNKWQSKFTKLQTIRLNVHTDADIIRFLSEVDNKQGLLKELIRAEMEKRGISYPHPSRKEIDKYEEYLCDLEYGEIDSKEDFKNEEEE